ATDGMMPGRWEGNYWDGNGAHATLVLTVDVDDSSFSGRCIVTPICIEGCGQFELPVTGAIHGDTVIFSLAIAEQPSPLLFRGSLHSAWPYAHQTIYGVAENTGSVRFTGGVWIIWRPEQ